MTHRKPSPTAAPARAEAAIRAPRRNRPLTARVLSISGASIALAITAALVAQLLTRLIALITNLAFFGRVSTELTAPADNHLGLWVIVVPVVGGLIVGALARWGSPAIRGHGIPEAMEQVLFNRSRIPPRMTVLKPLSAAIAIGTGGPFGAEGPIIATGGALGSLIGQLLHTTADERKTLVAAGAAAGMAATFGTPLSAVLLAIELLLFEYRARSIIPVALAAAAATGVRAVFVGMAPMFPVPALAAESPAALTIYIVIGAMMGPLAVAVSKAVYAVEDGFERLPVHWMWWPALGSLMVGVMGWLVPRTLGVGYDNIDQAVTGEMLGLPLALLCAAKFVSWVVALGSGTSGGTLAPLFTIGGALGSLLGSAAAAILPAAGIDARIAALVGMAALFSGASRALLASVVFAFETTQQPMGLLPLLGGCTASYLVASLLARDSIMTEKISRRGARVLSDYSTDYLERILVRDCAVRSVITLAGATRVSDTLSWLASGTPGASHQGFPVVDEAGALIGVVTRRDLFNAANPAQQQVADLIRRPPAVAYASSTLREAADHMVREDIGRLPVVDRRAPNRVIGILTRSDLLAAHQHRLDEAHRPEAPLRRRARVADRRSLIADG